MTSSPSHPSAIEVQDLHCGYGQHQALDGLNLHVPAGWLCGLLGPNGAGKSSLMRILATLQHRQSGEVRVLGLDPELQARELRERIGYLGQEIALDKILTGREHLRFHADLHHLAATSASRRIDELIEQLAMADWIDRRTGNYSGGMRRRLELACCLLHQPELLILDEPTVGLDIESRATIWTLLREITGRGTTVLLSSHYLEEMEALADHLAIIDSGRVIAQGTPASLKASLGGERLVLKVREFSDAEEARSISALLRQTRGVQDVVVNRAQGYALNLLVENADTIVATLRHQLQEARIPVFSLTQSRPSLDDVYLQATGQSLSDAELAAVGQRDPRRERRAQMR